jgi:hypothetical protein
MLLIERKYILREIERRMKRLYPNDMTKFANMALGKADKAITKIL